LSGSDVLVVDDGSEDLTSEVARSFGSHVVLHPKRLGKTVALRDGVNYAKENGYDIAVDLGADAIPVEGSIQKLIGALGSPDVGGASAQQVALPSGSRLAYLIDDVIWAVLAYGKEYQMRQTRSSFLGAVMFAFKLGMIDIDEAINDDEFVGFRLKSEGLRVVFVKDAIAYFDASVNLHHIMERRKRMFYGHLNQPKSDAPSMSLKASIFALFMAIKSRPQRLAWAVPAMAIEFISRMQAWRDYRTGNSAMYERWVSVYKSPGTTARAPLE
jgi:cellulose synthase/poly-beta-1,6-N-acetylglucosamine synthase-like glycosyltransferase